MIEHSAEQVRLLAQISCAWCRGLRLVDAPLPAALGKDETGRRVSIESESARSPSRHKTGRGQASYRVQGPPARLRLIGEAPRVYRMHFEPI